MKSGNAKYPVSVFAESGHRAQHAKRAPFLIAARIGAAITAPHYFLWVRCPTCRTTSSVDPRKLNRHGAAAVTALSAEEL
jgi:hypothetical protein